MDNPSGPGGSAPANPKNPPARRDPQEILEEYQIEDDEMVNWTPNLGPFPIGILFVGSQKITKTEAELLDELASDYGLLGLKKFQEISSNDPNEPGLAFATADKYYPRTGKNGQRIPGADDGHNDAFRHWNALMTRHFGEEFAAAMASAHEGAPGNPADREAMDVYNNEVGRRIAAENPEASDEELAQLIYEAVENGEMLVIDANGELAYSDEVEVGQTGTADDPPSQGGKTPPGYTSASE